MILLPIVRREVLVPHGGDLLLGLVPKRCHIGEKVQVTAIVENMLTLTKHLALYCGIPSATVAQSNATQGLLFFTAPWI
jgi:hypothetical protein